MSEATILLVDDDRQIGRLFRSSLELSGKPYRMVDVPSGEEALLELKLNPVDLLISDVRLPGMSGLELLAKVREQNPYARAIMITGHPSEEIRNRAHELGVVAFMTKPLHTNAFLETVEQALSLQHHELEQRQRVAEQSNRIQPVLQDFLRKLGAKFICVLDQQAQILMRAGSSTTLRMEELQPLLVTAISVSRSISTHLDEQQPWNIQYFGGREMNLYLMNISSEFALLAGVPSAADFGQVGTVARFSRTIISELIQPLSDTYFSKKRPDESSITAKESERVNVTMPESESIQAAKQPLDVDPYCSEIDKSQLQADALSGKEKLTYQEARRRGILPDDLKKEA